MKSAFALAVVLVLGLGSTKLATAHTAPRSSSTWMIHDSEIHVLYVIPGVEVVRLTSAATTKGSPGEFLKRYLESHIKARRSGVPCSLEGEPRLRVSPSDWTSLAQLTFACPPTGVFELESRAFTDLTRTHTHLARVIGADGTMEEFAFTKDITSHIINGTTQSTAAWLPTLWQFLGVGITHIATGTDHLAFLLGLALMARTWRRMVSLTCGFTVGHSVTLGLASANTIVVRPQLIEALVAFTVLVVGIESLSARFASYRLATVTCIGVLLVCAFMTAGMSLEVSLWPLYLGLILVSVAFFRLSAEFPQHDAWTQTGVTVTFGLIHGLAFASGLLEVHIPREFLLPAVAGFNFGIELGQLLFVGCALTASYLLIRITAPRLITVGQLAMALTLSCTAAWWFIDRMAQI